MFRKKIYGLIILGFFLTPVWCPADQPVQSPKAVLVEHAFEFQPVLEGSEIVHQFILKNNGDAPLNILKISAG